jgi:hypothetical protein
MSYTTIDQYPRTVSAAAKLLDKAVPGWYDRINIPDLDLGECRKCILGQLYGHFDDGCITLFGKYYFQVPLTEEEINSGEFTEGSNLILPPFGERTNRDEWVNEINKRRAKQS